MTEKEWNELKEKYHKQALLNIIAVDYDSTITKFRPYPEKAPLDKRAKKYLIKLNELGFPLVLWSARVDKDYFEALDRCHNEFGMPFILSDENLVHGQTGKLVACFYIDDHSYVNHKIPWRRIYRYFVTKRRKEK